MGWAGITLGKFEDMKLVHAKLNEILPGRGVIRGLGRHWTGLYCIVQYAWY